MGRGERERGRGCVRGGPPGRAHHLERLGARRVSRPRAHDQRLVRLGSVDGQQRPAARGSLSDRLAVVPMRRERNDDTRDAADAGGTRRDGAPGGHAGAPLLLRSRRHADFIRAAYARVSRVASTTLNSRPHAHASSSCSKALALGVCAIHSSVSCVLVGQCSGCRFIRHVEVPVRDCLREACEGLNVGEKGPECSLGERYREMSYCTQSRWW